MRINKMLLENNYWNTQSIFIFSKNKAPAQKEVRGY